MSRRPRKWAPAEDGMLLQRVEAQVAANELSGNPISWNQVAASFEDRSNKDCRKRWCKLRTKNAEGGQRAGAWEADEDQRLRNAYDMHGPKWSLVAESVGTRNADQCSKRWQHCLNPSLDRTGWSPDEDAKLLDAVKTVTNGNTPWKKLKEIFPGRSTTSMKNRHTALVKQQQKENFGQGRTSSLGTNAWSYPEGQNPMLETSTWSYPGGRAATYDTSAWTYPESRASSGDNSAWSYAEGLTGNKTLVNQEETFYQQRSQSGGLEPEPDRPQYPGIQYPIQQPSALYPTSNVWSTVASSTVSTPTTLETSSTQGGASRVTSPSLPDTDWELIVSRSNGGNAPVPAGLDTPPLGFTGSIANSPRQTTSFWAHQGLTHSHQNQIRPQGGSTTSQDLTLRAGVDSLNQRGSEIQQLRDEVAAKISSTTPQTILVLDDPKPQTLADIFTSLAKDNRKVSIMMNNLACQDSQDTSAASL